MNTIKLTNSSTNRAILSALAELNATLEKYSRAVDDHSKAMTCRIQALDDGADSSTLQRRCDVLSRRCETLNRKFDKIQSSLPPIKFDSASGEYFLAHDATGAEVFRIKCVSTFSAVVEVAAPNLEAAMEIVGTKVDSGKIDLEDAPLELTDVSVVAG